MKTFKSFLTESEKTYKFFVRVAGDLPEGFVDKMERNLNKYELLKLSAGKRTPIQEKPMDFPQLQNCEVTHYEVELKYPTKANLLISVFSTPYCFHHFSACNSSFDEFFLILVVKGVIRS